MDIINAFHPSLFLVKVRFKSTDAAVVILFLTSTELNPLPACIS